MEITHYKSTETRYSALEIIDYPRMGSPIRVCVMEQYIPNPQQGDLLWITGEIEVTNDLPYSVEVCRRLSWELYTGGNDGPIITSEAGENVSPQVWNKEIFPGQHHMLIPFSGVFCVPESSLGRFVSLVMYAGGSSYTQPNDYLKVETSTNHLSIIHIK